MSDVPGYQKFFAELKRRRVFRVMAVYGAAAFVILQVADIAFEPLGLPPWAITFLIVLVVLGFPLAIILAWAFDVTPAGVRRTEDAAPGEITEIIAAPPSTRCSSSSYMKLKGTSIPRLSWTTIPMQYELWSRSVPIRHCQDLTRRLSVEPSNGSTCSSSPIP